MAHILEAKCKKCGETFNPYSEDDLEHVTRADGQFCEGQGELLGAYSNLPTFMPPEPATKTNVVQLSTGNEGGWCGNITEHDSHDECEGS